MLQLRFLISLLVIALFTLNSCTTRTYRYKSNTINPHLFEEQGDFEVGTTASGLLGIQGAYAVTDNFAFGAAVSFISETDTISITDTSNTSLGDIIYKDNHTDFEFTFCYFNNIPNSNLAYEVQLGYAYDLRTEKVDNSNNLNISNTIYDFDKRNNPIYSRIFIQPAIGKNGRNFDWSFATRFQLVSYKDLSLRYPNTEYKNYSDFMLEPVFTIRGGFRFAKAMFQLGARITNKNGPYDYFSLNMGIGFVVPLNQFTRKIGI